MCAKVIDAEATSCHLREMLKEHGLTPRDVQEEMNLGSVQAVYKWISLKHKTIPALDNLITLTGLMDCRVDDILVFKHELSSQRTDEISAGRSRQRE